MTATADALIRRAASADPFFTRVHGLAAEKGAGPEVRLLSALMAADPAVPGDPRENDVLADQVQLWTARLGGHAPAMVFKDADVATAAKILVAAKYRNAGQVCVAPTRFLVQSDVYDGFVDRFVEASRALKVGNGLEEGVTMGPLANARRVPACFTPTSPSTCWPRHWPMPPASPMRGSSPSGYCSRWE